jgi:sugar phosphate isomerase/epimerase
MKLGFYTYSYIDRLGMSIEPVLEKVAATGYDGLDISATWRADLDPALFPREARETFKRECERLGLRIEACVTHLPLVQAVWNRQPINLPGAVDLAVELGAKVVTVHVGGSEDVNAAWQTAVDALRRDCAYAEQRGVVIATDAIWPPTILDSPEKVAQLIEDVGSPALKHNFDPCYLNVCGINPVDAMALLAPHVAHVHIKDHRGRYPKFDHLIPGDDGAEMNHAAWLRGLQESGFDGYAAVECFTNHPLDKACEIGYRTMAGAMKTVSGEP